MPVFRTVNIPVGDSFPSIEQMFLWVLKGDVSRMGAVVWIIPLIILLALLDIALKAVACRKAGNRKELAWFICLFIFNTCGILPLIYLIWF